MPYQNPGLAENDSALGVAQATDLTRTDQQTNKQTNKQTSRQPADGCDGAIPTLAKQRGGPSLKRLSPIWHDSPR
jgi:hypothetical protein